MTKKPDFTAANTERVYNAIETATAEPAPTTLRHHRRDEPPTADEIRLAQDLGKTQGRKGCKATRINMAFPPDVHDYIRTMARVSGESITDFTIRVFRQHMDDNAELYERAQTFRETLDELQRKGRQ